MASGGIITIRETGLLNFRFFTLLKISAYTLTHLSPAFQDWRFARSSNKAHNLYFVSSSRAHWLFYAYSIVLCMTELLQAVKNT